ncbi:MAG: DDE-type integrase/transposase/recombinase [Promethearchaeota archaeon]
MNTKKEDVNAELRQEAIHYYYHRKLTVSVIAEKLGKSMRTVYRWLEQEKSPPSDRGQKMNLVRKRQRQYSQEILTEILRLKEENPKRSARIIKNLLIAEKYSQIPSETTIRRYLLENGMGRVAAEARKGYIVFEREQPNELWQVDIAGVQTVAHLGPLYLFALIDDCSRFITAAFYADNQKGFHVIRLLQRAIVSYGRPLAIVADNGTQFRNILNNLDSKYEKLLKLLDIRPIFARARHPQTKGKLERFFGTVKSMFLSEARFQAKQHPTWTLADFNQKLQEWIEFYNTKHRHRSLPGRCSPATIHFTKTPRIYRPLEIKMDWDRWVRKLDTRKVSKTNFISYKGSQFQIPPGYAGLRVELRIFENILEVYYKQQCLTKLNVKPPILLLKKVISRRIAGNGTIGYEGKHYTISYKMAGKQVEVKQSADGSELLIYCQGQLIQRIKK